MNENKEIIRDLERRLSSLQEENRRLADALVAEKQNRMSSEVLSEEKTLLFQLMSHLFEFCQLFRSNDSLEDDDKRRNERLCRLLNSSEDLLNCASILVTSNALIVLNTLLNPIFGQNLHPKDSRV